MPLGMEKIKTLNIALPQYKDHKPKCYFRASLKISATNHDGFSHKYAKMKLTEDQPFVRLIIQQNIQKHEFSFIYMFDVIDNIYSTHKRGLSQ